MKKVVKDENQRCIVCGCILGKYRVDDRNICEICRDELDECNPYTQWTRGGSDNAND